jgi:ribA/ribD-fused uncharacterized protein
MLGERITETHIYFWNGIFCQWHPSLIIEGGQSFNCNEQYMIAKKAETFGDTKMLTEIMNTKYPRDQKALGREISNYDDDVWSDKRFEIVVQANRLKFDQNPDLKEMLLSTGDKILVEASYEDPIWGIGLHFDNDAILDESKWQGQNLLGKAIMLVREELK